MILHYWKALRRGDHANPALLEGLLDYKLEGDLAVTLEQG